MDTPPAEITVSSSPLPWIEVTGGEQRSSAAPPAAPSPAAVDEFRALFAARVKPLPFAQRAARKWGWNSENLRQEAIARQQQFLVGLCASGQFELRQPPAGPTLALSVLADPATGRLALCLLGADSGQSAPAARERAVDLWRTVATTFAYDYEVVPVASRQEFLALSGRELLEGVAGQDEIVEIRRFEMPLSTGHRPGLLLGLWQNNEHADEQVWRALAAAPRPTLLSIRVQPTLITTVEWPRLQAALDFTRAAEETNSEALKLHYDWANALYEKRLRSWLRPYLLQVHLVTVGGVPTYLQRAVGTAMTYRTDGNAQPSYQVVAPSDPSVLQSWRRALCRLSFIAVPPATDTNLLGRLHLLAGLEEVMAVFRWPYPPEGNLPGVEFM